MVRISFAHSSWPAVRCFVGVALLEGVAEVRVDRRQHPAVQRLAVQIPEDLAGRGVVAGLVQRPAALVAGGVGQAGDLLEPPGQVGHRAVVLHAAAVAVDERERGPGEVRVAAARANSIASFVCFLRPPGCPTRPGRW